MREFPSLPEEIQHLRHSIWDVSEMATGEVYALGDKASPSQRAGCHFASWTILCAESSMVLAEANTYRHPSMSMLRPCIECHTRVCYLVNLPQPTREQRATEFLDMVEIAQAKECETVLNDPERLSHFKASAPYDFVARCKSIIAKAQEKFPPKDKDNFKKRLRAAEQFWGYGNMQNLLKNMAKKQELQAALFRLDPYWISGCMAVHGNQSVWLYSPDFEQITRLALQLALGTTCCLALLNDKHYEPMSKATKQFLKCYRETP